MVRLQVADAGDGFQIWKVAVNILNKYWRRADIGWLPSWGFEGEVNTLSP
jgi:hypothetical protein